MAKASRIAFSNQHSTIRDVEKYYVDSEVALNLYFSPSSLNTFPARFISYSITEFDDELKIRKEALDKMCSLEVLAAIEAKFRIDYLNRCQNREKDDLSKKFRQIHKVKKNKALLVDDIFANWKQIYPEHKSRLDGLGRAFDFRNWLAHGKYWEPKKNPHIYQYDYLSVYSIASDILQNMDI